MTTEIFTRLTPEIRAALDRHPAAYRQDSPAAGKAVKAGPAESAPAVGKSAGQRDRWTCHHCGAELSAKADPRAKTGSAAERVLAAHRCGAVAIRFECVLR